MFNNSVRNLISANNISQNTQRGTDQTPPRKRTLEMCFLTTCFDVNCSCVDAKEATSLSSTSNKITRLGTVYESFHCMILNTRINGTKNELEKQNTTPKRGNGMSSV